MTVENIKTENHYDMLCNAIDRIHELEKQNAAMRERIDEVAKAASFQVGDQVAVIEECVPNGDSGVVMRVGYRTEVTVDCGLVMVKGSDVCWHPKHFRLVCRSQAKPQHKTMDDSSELVTAEWLSSCSPTKSGNPFWGVVHQIGGKFFVTHRGEIELQTRRDVRILCELLRVELKETK